MRRLFPLPLLLASLAACEPARTGENGGADTAAASGPATTGDTVAVRDTIVRLAEAIGDRWDALQPDSFMALLADDAVWVYEGQMIDRSGLERNAREFAGAHTTSETTWGETYVHPIGAEAALFSGTFRQGQTDTAGVASETGGALTLLFQRRDGEWKVVHAHESLPSDGEGDGEGDGGEGASSGSGGDA